MDHFQTHLKSLDVSLACGICSEVFDTPLLIRTCGHSFCAACIRQNIDFQEKNGNTAYCPTCRVSCDARDLIANVVLRDVVEKYSNIVKWCHEQEEEQACMRERQSAGDKNGALCVISDDEEMYQDVQIVESESYSSGEEYDPKKERHGKRKVTKTQQSCPPSGPTIGTSSFLECPICGKSVHHLSMNGHIDQCLNKEPHKESSKPSWKPLEVPSKIIGTLANDKTIKAALKKYGIPCEGKKSELMDRYNRFRTEVEIANDKHEATTYERIVFRIAKQEKYKAAASLFKSRTNDTSTLHPSTSMFCTSLGQVQKKKSKRRDDNQGGIIDMTLQSPPAKHPSDIQLPEDPSYEDLIKITKRRDRLRRRLLVDGK